ncbi:hypothetical protein SAMN05216311_1167 [Chitinophaga sp. CF418]|nr:hypothetical protein SAMN05216311_1167 [Chitinophaga sp. CF418]
MDSLPKYWKVVCSLRVTYLISIYYIHMKAFIIFVSLLFFISCNQTLFVPKGNIIHNQRGYLVFYYSKNEALFFPSASTVNVEFVTRNHLNGYSLEIGKRVLII